MLPLPPYIAGREVGWGGSIGCLRAAAVAGLSSSPLSPSVGQEYGVPAGPRGCRLGVKITSRIGGCGLGVGHWQGAVVGQECGGALSPKNLSH